MKASNKHCINTRTKKNPQFKCASLTLWVAPRMFTKSRTLVGPSPDEGTRATVYRNETRFSRSAKLNGSTLKHKFEHACLQA